MAKNMNVYLSVTMTYYPVFEVIFWHLCLLDVSVLVRQTSFDYVGDFNVL